MKRCSEVSAFTGRRSSGGEQHPGELLLLAAGSGRVLGRRPPASRPRESPIGHIRNTRCLPFPHLLVWSVYDLALSFANMKYIIHIIHSFVKVWTKLRDSDGILCRFSTLNRESVQSPPVPCIQKKTPCPQKEGRNFRGNSYSVTRRGLRFLYWKRFQMLSTAASIYTAAASMKG